MVRTAAQKIADVLIFLCGFLIFCDILLLPLTPALALLAQLFAVQLETVAGDLETALVQASGAAIAGRILFVITLIFETMAVVSHHFAARDRT